MADEQPVDAPDSTIPFMPRIGCPNAHRIPGYEGPEWMRRRLEEPHSQADEEDD